MVGTRQRIGSQSDAARRPIQKTVEPPVAIPPNTVRMTTLNDTQKQQVRQWLQQGLQLAEIQKRLSAEFDLRLTYMEVKFLVGDLDLVPQDREPAPEMNLPAKPPAGADKPATPASPPPPTPPAAGKVRVSVDTIARPGAIASGTATFTDGKTAGWYLDEAGRLGLVAPEPGYRPPAADVAEFQASLERELVKLGL